MADADARSGLTTQEQIEEMRRELERAASPAQKRKRRGKKIIVNFLSIIFVVLVMAVAFTLLQIWSVREQDKTPTMFGYYFYEVESDGAAPLLSSGSIIFAKEPGNTAMLQPGDIVTFLTSGQQLRTRMIADTFVDNEGAVAYHTGSPDGTASVDQEVLNQDQIVFVMIFPIPFFS
jgi:signal peptidase I